MAMPDGVEALLRLAGAPAASLTRQVYNVGAFNPSAGEIRAFVLEAFPGARLTFEPDLKSGPRTSTIPPRGRTGDSPRVTTSEEPSGPT